MLPPAGLAADVLAELHDLAEEAARRGGQTARTWFERRLNVRLKADRSEVSDADEAAQAEIVTLLRARRPADAFIAEESLGPSNIPPCAPDRVCWVIDPIDGTRNYVRGIPIYSCSVAAMYNGWPVAGAIYDPPRDLLYSATIASGLHIDGRPAARDMSWAAERLGDLQMRPFVGIPSNAEDPWRTLAHNWFDRFLCRNFGSTALHLAMVAAGELDAMFADNARLWDIAAGFVLVTVVGGQVLGPGGGPLFPIDLAHYTSQKLPTVAGTAAFFASDDWR
jgi:myo-inositol-1(or 4)-monophosphatase